MLTATLDLPPPWNGFCSSDRRPTRDRRACLNISNAAQGAILRMPKVNESSRSQRLNCSCGFGWRTKVVEGERVLFTACGGD